MADKIDKTIPSTPRRNGSSPELERRKERAREVLASAPPSAEQAIELATDLIGQWPFARPGDRYVDAVAAALRRYPVMLAAECCEPATGLASVRDPLPTIASVVEWCNRRLDLYRALGR